MITLKKETAEAIRKEMESIPEKYQKPFNSTHEGYAVLLEEVRELEHVVFFGEKEAKKESEECYQIIHLKGRLSMKSNFLRVIARNISTRKDFEKKPFR